MKKFFLLFILAVYAHICLAQSMQGYVKTKGRMVDGKVVHGVGLSGVTIRIKGINVVMSGKDGLFFISFPQNQTGDCIYIESISKPGYELVDKDILNSPIIYNPNSPLTIVMEEESILAEEMLALETKLRRTLLLQLEKAEKEIEELDVSIEEKNRKLQELYKRQSSQEHLINDMVNQYGKYDFDVMSIFDLKVTECIINGELEKADSLLNTKGDISERENKLNEINETIPQSDSIIQSEKARLSIFADSLHKRGRELINEGKISEGRECTRQAMEIRKELLGEVSEDYITSLNNYAYSFGAEKKWEKAVELQEQVMELCRKLKTPHKDIGMYTTNMGRYYYLTGDKIKAAQMWEQALTLVEKSGEIYDFLLNGLASVYNDLGDQQSAIGIVALMEEHNQYEIAKPCDEPKCMLEHAQYYGTMGNWEKAKECYLKALDMPMDNETKAQVYEAYASYLGGIVGEFAAGADYYLSAANIRKGFVGETEAYANLMYKAGMYAFLGKNYESTTIVASRFLNELSDDESALKFYNSALKIAVDRSGGLGSPDIASTHQSIGKVYYFQGNFTKAIEEYNYALSLQRELMGDSTRHVGQSLMLIGISYNSMKKYDLALDYYKDALIIYDNIFKVNNSSEIANIYNNMGVAYENKKDNKQALHYYEMALNMRKELYDYEHPDIAYSYSNIAGVYDHMEDYDKAIAYYQKSIDVLKKSKGSKHQDVGLMYNNIAATYYNMDELETSLSNFNQALEIMKIFLPEDHPNIRAIIENIEIVKNEIKRN